MTRSRWSQATPSPSQRHTTIMSGHAGSRPARAFNRDCRSSPSKLIRPARPDGAPDDPGARKRGRHRRHQRVARRRGECADAQALRSRVVGFRSVFAGRSRRWSKPTGTATVADASCAGREPGRPDRRAYSAIEIACLDLIGKSVGKPVCDLLGGRMRDEVPFSAYLFYKHGGGGGPEVREDEYGECLTPEAIVRQARQMVRKYGFRSIKLKAGVLEPDVEIETMRQLYAASGRGSAAHGSELRVDRRDVDARGPRVVERARWRGLPRRSGARDRRHGGGAERLVESHVATPLASNVAVTSFADIPACVTRDAVQIVLCDPHYWGGLRQIQHLSKMCRTFGLGLSMHSNSHLGVSLMAMAHCAAAAPHLTYACDTHYPWHRPRTKSSRAAAFRSERIGPHTRPSGLGVTLDHDQLARGRERYARCEFRNRDDEQEMRKHVDPAWRRIVPRWW